jgi:fluoroquinolone resistance protein
MDTNQTETITRLTAVSARGQAGGEVTEVLHANKVFEKLVYSETGLPGGEFEACTFILCNFYDADLTGRRFTDCRMIDCNLSMARLSRAGLNNVTFMDCKVTGVDFRNCLPLLFEVSFEKSNLDYCIFCKNRLKKTKFKECSIREANFTEADLTGASFDNCDLSNTVFNRTNLSHADFRTARNYSINLALNTVRKAKFSLSGIAGLLSRYDIVIE